MDFNSAKKHYGPNLEILTWIDGEWARGLAQNNVNLDFQV